MYLPDTNILSEPVRRVPHAQVMHRWEHGQPGEFFTTSVCLMELRYGAAKAVQPDTIWQRIESTILTRGTVLPFEAEDALRAGEIQAALAGQGLAIE